MQRTLRNAQVAVKLDNIYTPRADRDHIALFLYPIWPNGAASGHCSPRITSQDLWPFALEKLNQAGRAVIRARES
jgi:hypothetical protein